MSAWLLRALVEALLASSAAILIVLALRPAWRAAFGAEAVVALWTAVPAAIVAVAIPGRVVAAVASHGSDWGAPSVAAAVAGPQGIVDVAGRLVLAAWLVGALAATWVQARAQHRFLRQLGPLGPGPHDAYRSASTRFGAVVVGVLRPRVVLPADFEQRYTPQQQELILLHERSHVARADLPASAIAAGLRCVFWFNPLVHYAAHCLARDQEIASDAAVVRARPHLRGLYASTLLHDQLVGTHAALARQWGKKPIEERLTMLGRPTKPRSLTRAGAALAAAATLALAAGAWAAQPPRADIATTAWSSTVVTVKGDDLTLRQAIEIVADASGVSIAEGHLLDEARPASDLDVEFTDMPAATALEIMLEDLPATLDYTIEPEGVRFSRKP